FARPRVRFRFLSFKTPPEKPTHYTTSAAKRNGTGAGNLVDPPARIRAPRTVRRLHNLGRAGQAKSSPLFRFPDFGPEYTGGLFPPAFSPVAGRFMVKWREDLSDGGAKAMIDLALAREQAALLAAAMERHSPVRELEDGYALFRDKRVTHAWKDRFNIVHAIVRTEEGDRKLQIDLDFFLASECGCSRGFRICAHSAAVSFLLYGEQEDPAAWLAEVVRSRQRASGAAGSGRTGPVPCAGPGGGPSGNAAGVASIGTPSMPPARPEAGRSVPPHRWGTLVDRELQRLLGLLGDRKRIDIFYLNACRKLHALAEGFSAGERAAFRLFAALR